MKRIQNFSEFFLEKFIAQTDDSFSVASAKNKFNKEEDFIRNFNKYKKDIEFIYLNYSDEQDLLNRLLNKKLIKKKTADPKKKEFNDELLGKWAEICSYKRMIQDKEKLISGTEDEIKNKDITISDNKGNQTIIDYTQKDINNSVNKIKEHEKEIEDLRKKILDLDKQLRKDFKLKNDKNKNSKNRLIKYQMDKKSNPADTSDEETQK